MAFFVDYVCDGTPCQNNGSCIPTSNVTYDCTCELGFSGTNCNGKCPIIIFIYLKWNLFTNSVLHRTLVSSNLVYLGL